MAKLSYFPEFKACLNLQVPDSQQIVRARFVAAVLQATRTHYHGKGKPSKCAQRYTEICRCFYAEADNQPLDILHLFDEMAFAFLEGSKNLGANNNPVRDNAEKLARECIFHSMLLARLQEQPTQQQAVFDILSPHPSTLWSVFACDPDTTEGQMRLIAQRQLLSTMIAAVTPNILNTRVMKSITIQLVALTGNNVDKATYECQQLNLAVLSIAALHTVMCNCIDYNRSSAVQILRQQMGDVLLTLESGLTRGSLLANCEFFTKINKLFRKLQCKLFPRLTGNLKVLTLETVCLQTSLSYFQRARELALAGEEAGGVLQTGCFFLKSTIQDSQRRQNLRPYDRKILIAILPLVAQQTTTVSGSQAARDHRELMCLATASLFEDVSELKMSDYAAGFRQIYQSINADIQTELERLFQGVQTFLEENYQFTSEAKQVIINRMVALALYTEYAHKSSSVQTLRMILEKSGYKIVSTTNESTNRRNIKPTQNQDIQQYFAEAGLKKAFTDLDIPVYCNKICNKIMIDNNRLTRSTASVSTVGSGSHGGSPGCFSVFRPTPSSTATDKKPLLDRSSSSP